MSLNPAAPRIDSTPTGCASEKGFAPWAGPGVGLPGLNAASMATAHSFRLWLCHTSISRRASGRAARAILLNGPVAGTLEQLFGDVHPKHLASHGSARGVARGLPGATPDVQHTVGTADARRRAEAVVEPAQLGIVVIGHRQRHSRSTTCGTISRSRYSTSRI